MLSVIVCGGNEQYGPEFGGKRSFADGVEKSVRICACFLNVNSGDYSPAARKPTPKIIENLIKKPTTFQLTWNESSGKFSDSRTITEYAFSEYFGLYIPSRKPRFEYVFTFFSLNHLCWFFTLRLPDWIRPRDRVALQSVRRALEIHSWRGWRWRWNSHLVRAVA